MDPSSQVVSREFLKLARHDLKVYKELLKQRQMHPPHSWMEAGKSANPNTEADKSAKPNTEAAKPAKPSSSVPFSLDSLANNKALPKETTERVKSVIE